MRLRHGVAAEVGLNAFQFPFDTGEDFPRGGAGRGLAQAFRKRVGKKSVIAAVNRAIECFLMVVPNLPQAFEFMSRQKKGATATITKQ